MNADQYNAYQMMLDTLKYTNACLFHSCTYEQIETIKRRIRQTIKRAGHLLPRSERIAPNPGKTVMLHAAGFEWICTECDHLQEETKKTARVMCDECGSVFDVVQPNPDEAPEELAQQRDVFLMALLQLDDLLPRMSEHEPIAYPARQIMRDVSGIMNKPPAPKGTTAEEIALHYYMEALLLRYRKAYTPRIGECIRKAISAAAAAIDFTEEF